MEITIRRAVKEDCPRLLELVHELAAYERAPDQVTVTLDHFVSTGFGEHPIWWAFVAEHIDPHQEKKHLQIIGFALYYIRYSTWKGMAMYLEDILVTASMRGNGIGGLLFDRLIQEAKEKGFNRVLWQVLEWNEPAINFYKKYNAEFDNDWVNCCYYLVP
jgi:GNAT superfamily N-acetyltransferase